MTDAEKLTYAKGLTNNDPNATDALMNTFLRKAKSAVLRKLYPFGIPDTATDVPGRYEELQCELAVRYFFRSGGEGEIQHSENGVARIYSSTDDRDLLNVIVPYAKVYG